MNAPITRTTYATLKNGLKMPLIGLGTLGWSEDPNELVKTVATAIDIGYRHVDTAFVYNSEKQVGQAINNKINDGTIKRQDLFVTTKVGPMFHQKDHVMECLKMQLASLNLSYVDLYLIHSPMSLKRGENTTFDPHAIPEIDTVDPLDTWKGMEQVYKAGLAKAIGVSNFNHKQIQRLIDNSDIQPMVLQVECHAYCPQRELSQWLNDRDIVLTAYSPLGAPWRAQGKGTAYDDKNAPNLLADKTVLELSAKYNRKPGQILLRWLTQRGIVAIPKSTNSDRQKQNLEVLDFELTADEVTKMSNLGPNGRTIANTFPPDHPHNPFVNEAW